MATSADRDERDEDEKDEADESAKKDDKAAKVGETPTPPGKVPGPAEDRPAKGSSARADKAEEAEEDEEDGEDKEEEDEEEAKPAAKSTAKSGGKSAAKATASAKSDAVEDDEDEDEDDDRPAPKRPGAKGPGARAARGPGARRGRAAPPPQSGSLGKSVLLFVVIVVGLGAGFAILGREAPPEIARPKWKAGDMADVEITLVASDRQDLACASDTEIAGKHCAFEAMNKPWSKGGDPSDDKQILKPYTTIDRVQFAAAGLWADPAMAAGKLPATRFTVKCKYKVEGMIKNVAVRWEQTGQWYPNNEWYAGSISDCKLSP